MSVPPALPSAGRLLGVDLGDVRMGLAVSDPSQVVASPLEVVAVDDADDLGAIADAIATAVTEHAITGVVLGLPRTLSGRDGAAAHRARRVAARVEERTGIGVALWDERFSTVEAERVMLAQGAKRRERRASVDRVAAAVILQGFLESRR